MNSEDKVKIREALEVARLGHIDRNRNIDLNTDYEMQLYLKAGAALSRLEAREAEWPDTVEIVGQIRNGGLFLSNAAAGALIGQYAYRYSEDIRRERDEWKALAEQYADEAEENKGKSLPWELIEHLDRYFVDNGLSDRAGVAEILALYGFSIAPAIAPDAQESWYRAGFEDGEKALEDRVAEMRARAEKLNDTEWREGYLDALEDIERKPTLAHEAPKEQA